MIQLAPDRAPDFQLPADLEKVLTADGSFTLRSAALGEQYHSLHGAVTESMHVYIRNGLLSTGKDRLDVLEVGLGTGLNALLTLRECRQAHLGVDYLALEPHPLPAGVLESVDHAAAVAGTDLPDLINLPAGEWTACGPGCRFRWERKGVLELDAEQAFDLVYYDAFAPAVQPEMWTLEVFERIFRAMRPGALLVTYCAKGAVRRTMLQAGLEAVRVPGPPGKYHMLKATRPR